MKLFQLTTKKNPYLDRDTGTSQTYLIDKPVYPWQALGTLCTYLPTTYEARTVQEGGTGRYPTSLNLGILSICLVPTCR